MTRPSEAVRARLRLTDEERAEVDAGVNDPNGEAKQVEWLDPGPDPLGMNWGWLQEPEAQAVGRTASPTDVPNILSLSGARHSRAVRQRAFRIAGLAAALLVAAVGAWAALRGSRGELLEQNITAWATQKLEPAADGIHIAAPADDREPNEQPLINSIDRPRDVERPTAPNIYAPISIQDQLVVPVVPPNTTPQPLSERPLRTVVQTIRPGSLFYIEFTTASTPTTGTAVLVRTRPEPWQRLRDEVAVRPVDGTCYYGPLKMEEGGVDYLVILSDRTSTPLLATVDRALSIATSGSLDELRPRLARALKAAGHGWYGLQRIEVRPEPTRVPRP